METSEEDLYELNTKYQRTEDNDELITETLPLYSIPLFIIRILQKINLKIISRYQRKKHQYINPTFYGESIKQNHTKRITITLLEYNKSVYLQIRKIPDIVNILHMNINEHKNLVPCIKNHGIKVTDKNILIYFYY